MLKILSVFWAASLLLMFSSAGFSQQAALPAAAVNVQKKWSDVIEPGRRAPSWSTRDKLIYPLHEELRLTGWFPTFASAGWEHLIDSHPRYGVDSGAFGQRLGAAAIRDLSMRTFSDGVLPALMREDPRYFRKRDGAIAQRGFYAVSRAFVGRRDDGSTGFNSSVVIGHGMGSALTMAYYPEKSAKGSVVLQTWGVSLLGEAGGNLWSEFWPDVRDKLFHRHHDSQF